MMVYICFIARFSALSVVLIRMNPWELTSRLLNIFSVDCSPLVVEIKIINTAHLMNNNTFDQWKSFFFPIEKWPKQFRFKLCSWK